MVVANPVRPRASPRLSDRMSDPESTPARQRSLPRRLLNRMEVDRAVFFSVLGRAWQFLAGPVTAYLIAANLTAVSQGFYYAFLPLLAMQAFVELGLHTLTVITASHEWAHLSLAADGAITEMRPLVRS